MHKVENIMFGNRQIGPGNRCYIIAEIGVNFNGDLELAKKSIDAAADSGADAAKFQTFCADEFVADKSLMYTYAESDGTVVTESQYEMFKRLELPHEWHVILKKYAEEAGIDFLSSAADKKAADLLADIEVKAFKLASEDLINIDLLEYVAAKKFPTILSTGMADVDEIDAAVKIFEEAGNRRLVILHCVSSYPTPFDQCNLRRIRSMQARYGYPIGFSDHTEGWEAPMLSIGAGACLIEKHFTLDKNLKGPDHKMSSDPEELARMVSMVRTAEELMGREGLKYADVESSGRAEFRRSVVASGYLPAGTVITKKDIAYKRPGIGLKPYQRDIILGRTLKRDLECDERIMPEDVI